MYLEPAGAGCYKLFNFQSPLDGNNSQTSFKDSTSEDEAQAEEGVAGRRRVEVAERHATVPRGAEPATTT